MAINDIYELTVNQRFLDQKCANVFFYKEVNLVIPVGVTTSQVIADQFLTQVVPSIRLIQTNDVTIDGIAVRNLFTPNDSFELLTSLVGQGGTNALPAFNALSAKLSTVEATVKSGAKRFCGVSAAFVQDGVVTDASYMQRMMDLGDKLEEPLNAGLFIQGPAFYPVVVKRVREGFPDAYTYRLPSNVSESVTSQLARALLSFVVTSQLSRKIGVGS